jgi:hypothetical protein
MSQAHCVDGGVLIKVFFPVGEKRSERPNYSHNAKKLFDFSLLAHKYTVDFSTGNIAIK